MFIGKSSGFAICITNRFYITSAWHDTTVKAKYSVEFVSLTIVIQTIDMHIHSLMTAPIGQLSTPQPYFFVSL